MSDGSRELATLPPLAYMYNSADSTCSTGGTSTPASVCLRVFEQSGDHGVAAPRASEHSLPPAAPPLRMLASAQHGNA